MSRSGRHSNPGMLSGRLRGGFLASSLPATASASDGRTSSNDTSMPRDPRPPLQEDIDDNSPESVARMVRFIRDAAGRLERRLVSVEDGQVKLADSLKELHELMKKQEREKFAIKGSPLETSLKEEMARIFCLSLTRKPTESDIHGVVARVIGRVDQGERYKYQMASKFCKAKLTEYRSEERRKVLGHAPYSGACYLSTPELARQIMHQMRTPGDVDENIYIRHVAIFRRFVRLSSNDSEVNYGTFRTWLGSSFLSEDRWRQVMEEDERFDYSTKGVGREVAYEVEVHTHTGAGDHDGSDIDDSCAED